LGIAIMNRKLSVAALGWTLVAVTTAAVVAGCEQTPVVWDATPDAMGAPVTAAPTHLGSPPDEPGMCRQSMQFAGRSPVLWAAWWTARPDSSVALRIARSGDDGAHWSAPLSADTTDRGVRGCARPAPAIAYDPDSAWVHLAYFIEPQGGTGVYYEHYMDGMFHAPVAIVYGTRPVAVAVAAAQDTVVVAYEDPNRRVSQVALALSTTAGHLFTIRVPASGEDVAAHHPAVALAGRRVTVGWRETPSHDDEETGADSSMGRPVVRAGTLRPGV
jgi:hypothetical protein